MGKGKALYLKRTRESELVEITGAGAKATFGNNLILWFGTDDEHKRIMLHADRRVLVAVLKKLLAAIEIESTPENSSGANRMTPAVMATVNNWDWLTPQMVIDKFASSPNLRAILPDVKKVLGASAAEERARADAANIESLVSHEDVFDETGAIKHGAKSKVARLLGVKYAGNYRARVDSVIEKLAA